MSMLGYFGETEEHSATQESWGMRIQCYRAEASSELAWTTCCYIPYSAKFSRHIISAVFANFSCTTKYKLAKCFLNFTHRFLIRDGSVQTD